MGKQGTVFRLFLMRFCLMEKTVIRPEELEDLDTDESSILEHKNYAETLKASRDNIAICKKSTRYGINFVMLGMESQEHIHLRNAYENNGL